MMSVIGVDEVYRLESDNLCFRRRKYYFDTQVLLKTEFTGRDARKRKTRNDF